MMRRPGDRGAEPMSGGHAARMEWIPGSRASGVRRAGGCGAAVALGLGLLLGAGFGGCAGHQGLQALAPATDAVQLRRALAPFDAVPQPLASASAPAVVWLVAGNPLRLAAYDLRRRAFKFLVRADVASRVVVGRGFGACASDEGAALAAFDSERGTRRWRQSSPRSGWRVLGLTASDRQVFVVWGPRRAIGAARVAGTSEPQASVVAYDGLSGEQRWAMPSRVLLGAPSAWRDYLVLPMQRQGLVVLGASDGRLVARLPWRGDAITWTEANGEGVFFGGRSGVQRLGAAVATGVPVEALTRNTTPPSVAGVTPLWGRRGYDGAPWAYGAGDRQRWVWRRAATGAPADDPLTLLHYRFLLGFGRDPRAPQALRLTWLRRAQRADFVAATHNGHLLAAVSADGELLLLDPRSGAERGRAALGLPVQGATFDHEGWTGPPGPAAAVTDLRAVLVSALLNVDARFPGLARYLLGSLADSPGPPPTAVLLQLTRAAQVPAALRDAALDYLSARPDAQSTGLYLALLAERHDYLLGTQASSVEVAARAAGALRILAAVRPLLRQLADPQTPLPALAAIVDALWAIGDRRALEALRELLLTYRCEPELAWMPQILVAAAAAVLEWGGVPERELVAFVAADPRTLPVLRQGLARLLDGDDRDDDESSEGSAGAAGRTGNESP